jgi:anti-sigma factor RsiW
LFEDVTEVDCHSVFERLSADLDGELSTAEAEAVRRHILSCAECAQKRTLLEKTRWAFRSIALKPVSPSFDDGVIRRLREGHGRNWWLRAAAAGLAAALGFVLLRSPARPASVAVTAPPSPSFAAFSAPVPPAPDVQPGWSDGRVEAAADCVLSGAVVCRVETPCGDGQCSPVALIDLAGLTRPNVAFTNTR